VWYAQGNLVTNYATLDENPDGHTTLRVMLLLALTATLAPSAFTITGADHFETAISSYLSPLLLFATTCAAIVQSFRRFAIEAATP
jgi:hypothetical protein